MHETPYLRVPVDQLENSLRDGAILTARRDELAIPRPLSVMRIGTVSVRSGHLIAGDAGMAFEMAEPFVRHVPPGEYDVLVSIWGLFGRGDSPSDGMGDAPRAAHLALVLSRERPFQYEFASTGSKPLDWAPTDAFDGFGVDVGGVGLLDVADLERFRSFSENSDFLEIADHTLRRHPEWGGIAGCVSVPTDPPMIVPMCDSGWGDGSYFSYWGLNATGVPVALIVDFDLDEKWASWGRLAKIPAFTRIVARAASRKRT